MEGNVTPLYQLWKEWSLPNKITQKNIKNLQNSVKRPWVEAFLYYLTFELDKTAEMNRNLI